MKSYITEEFRLLDENARKVIAVPVEFGFEGFGEFIFYRTYSRMIKDQQETFHDTVLRVINGVMSIRKTHYVRNCIEWDETYWQDYATRMCITMIKMHWLPPGRGLWAMGTDYVAKRGAMALYNCAYTSIISLPDDIEWIMDLLMNGVGVGFAPIRNDSLELYEPDPEDERLYVIPDSREGWCESIKLLLQSYADLNQPTMSFDYARIRPEGKPIAGFGGTASGPVPLRKLHGLIKGFCERYMQWSNSPYGQETCYDSVRLKTDLANAVGVCVIAGNVRRSAEIALGDIHDQTFMDLKDYDINPDRKGHGYMSNNSALLKDPADFEMLGEIAKRVVEKGEPGVVNLLNFPFGRMRLGKRDEVQFDKADGLNPCITPDTWVMTDCGPHRASELFGKQSTIIVNGREYKTADKGFFSTGKQKVFRVTTKEGHVVNVTQDHKLEVVQLTPKRRYPSWRKTNELQIGDLLSLNNHRNYYWDSYGSESEGYLLGQLVGDGTITDSYARLEFYESNLIEALKCYENVFGGNVKVSAPTAKKDVINSADLKRLAKNFDLDKFKVIGDMIEGSSYDFYCGFLKGFFDADGSVQGEQEKGISVRLAQSDLARLKAIQRMLLRLGINSTIYEERRPAGLRELPDGKGETKLYECKADHELVISNDNLLEYFRKIGFDVKHKHQRLIELLSRYKRKPNRERFVATIKSIEEIGIQEVCDVQVPGINAFDANGIVSHNCGEIPLENKEVCNIAETFPTRCTTEEEWIQACEFATFYCTTVSMLPTHRAETNRVVMRNRRIGIGIVDFTGWKCDTGIHKITKYMRNGYKTVVATAKRLAEEAGIPAPIRHTTIKPGGTVPKLAGKTSGIMYPNFKYMIRRVNVAKTHPVSQILIDACVRYEQHVHEDKTWVFEFPIICGPAKPVTEISLWEQAVNLALVQREWADNAVSNTLDFKPAWNLIEDKTFEFPSHGVSLVAEFENNLNFKIKQDHDEFDPGKWNIKVYKYDPHNEEDVVEEVLSFLVPITKSISMLPHTADGVYAQMPESGISEEEHKQRRAEMKTIDWTQLSGSDGVDSRYCDGDYCQDIPGEPNA